MMATTITNAANTRKLGSPTRKRGRARKLGSPTRKRGSVTDDSADRLKPVLQQDWHERFLRMLLSRVRDDRATEFDCRMDERRLPCKRFDMRWQSVQKVPSAAGTPSPRHGLRPATASLPREGLCSAAQGCPAQPGYPGWAYHRRRQS